MNKNKFLKKYYIAVYTVILTLAIIAFLLAYFRNQENIWQATLLNLATELLGVVLVFFFVQYLFRVDDELNTNERIKKLLTKLENVDKPLASDFFHEQPETDNLIRNSQNIKILGVTLTVCIVKGINAFREAIENGASVKILLLKNSPEAFKVAANRSETYSTAYFEKKHATTLDSINSLLKLAVSSQTKGNMEVRMINFPPNCGIEIFENNRKNSAEDKIKVEIYSHFSTWDTAPIFTVEKEQDKKWYHHFEAQFDKIWERAEKYEIPKQT